MSEQNGGNSYGIIEDMAEDIAEIRRRLRKIEAAQGYAEMGELSTSEETTTLELISELEGRGVISSEYSAKLRVDEQYRKTGESFRHFGEHLAGAIRKAMRTPQRRRDEIVDRAKADVGGLKDEDGDYYVNHRSIFAEFIVNREKRTVVVLLRGIVTGRVRERGIAKCSPDDCFNASIGKAVALRRALGLDVPAEYLKAPQPEIVRAGDVIKFRNINGDPRVETVDIGWNEAPERGKLHASSRVAEKSVIIDDSREEAAK